MREIAGIIPIIAATFTKEGDLDGDSFQHLIRHLVKTGIHGLTLFGLATEFYKLSENEKLTMQKIFLSELTKHSDIVSMVSITDHSLELARQNARMVQELGADSIMLLPPFFLQPSQEAIMHHIEEVAKSVSIQVIVQYAPSQTGVRIDPNVFIRLNERFEHIQFIKVETQPPGKYVSEIITGSQQKLKALVGYAGIQMPDVLNRGAVGIQPGCSFSEIYVDLYGLYKAGKMDAFLRKFNELLPYISYWMQGVELIIKVEKYILFKRGIIESEYCRAPFYRLDQVELEMVDRFLEYFKSNLS
jgi:2-keto-3-deoxy-L-arabinonate dehydratase